MTQKEIRDIAAYWGVNCLISLDKEQRGWEGRKVDAYVLDYIDSVKGIKLHLRPIASLTNEEVFDIAEIALERKVKRDKAIVNRPDDPSDYPIIFGDYTIRLDKSTYHRKYWISIGGLFGCGTGADGNEISTYREAEIFSYLQSIGVYVPGSIHSQYVQLI